MKKEVSEKKARLDALFVRDEEPNKLTPEKRFELERLRDRADRLLTNPDFVAFMTELELDYGGLNYSTGEIDLFTQGRISFFNDMKYRLYISEKAPKVFAKMVEAFINPFTEDFQRILSEEKETENE